jgi:uncharacterized membrane protein YeiB
MQTLIATFVFYGWGLGYWGKVGPALDIAIAAGFSSSYRYRSAMPGWLDFPWGQWNTYGGC